MAFLVTIIQTDTRFNQVIGSCLRSGYADNKEQFAEISETLKEVPGNDGVWTMTTSTMP